MRGGSVKKGYIKSLGVWGTNGTGKRLRVIIIMVT